MSRKKQQLSLVDAPIYRYWQALYLSFFSQRLYVDVYKRWRGFGFLYLLLVIALASLPLSLRIMHDFNTYFNENIILPFNELPKLYVQKGEIIFDKPMPYFIKNKKGELVGIIDTTQKVTEINSNYPHLAILITKEKIYFRPPKIQLFIEQATPSSHEPIYEYPLDKEDNEVFVGEEWIKTSGVFKLKLMAQLLIYPLIMLFMYGVYLVLIPVLGFLGQLFAQIFFKVKFKFKESCRLLAIAATAQIVLMFAGLATNFMLPGFGFIFIGLLAAYYSFAVISVKRAGNKMVRL